MTTSARRLLRSLDPLPFAARRRLLARTARELVGTPELDRLLDDLHGRGPFERLTAVQIAYVAGHRAHVERCLSAPETAVVHQALGAAIRLDLPGAVFRERLPHLPTDLRRLLYGAVRRRERRALADALLPVARSLYGDHEAAGLLPACSSDVVRAALPELEHAVGGWTAVGRRHPGVVLDFVEAELSATAPTWWAGTWQRFGQAVVAAARAEPGRVLDLFERVLPHVPLPWELDKVVGRLARHAPERVAALLVDPRRTGPLPARRSLWRALAVLPEERLVPVARVLDGGHQVGFLRAVAPSRRAAVVAGVFGDRPDVPLPVLDELPSAARGEAARRLLGLRVVADDPVRRLEVTARLPWEEAREALLTATRRAAADDRATAYPLYLSAAAATRDPEVVGGVVAGLAGLTNEQDPVRARAIGALAAIPGWLFRPDEADVLVKVALDAAQARDSSWRTQHAVRALAAALIREGAVSRRPALVDAGLAAVEHLGGHATSVDLSNLERVLPRGAEERVFAALEPRITADARRGRHAVLLGLAAGLGKRAWRLDRVQELLDRARSAKDDHVVRRAVDLWLAPPATRDERVERVFRDDPSTITLHAVREAIGRRRTDLLDRVAAGPLHGRFLKRGVRYVPAFRGCFHRWLPRQVEAHAAALRALVDARRVPAVERASAARALGRVPGTADVLRGFLADPEVQVVEAALGALAWTDEPSAVLPDLLAHVDTDRARVAVHALARCARSTPPDRLGELLAPLSAGRKVTARKEAVRLLARHRVPGAATVLAGAWDGAHRDVKRALVSATRWFLDDPAAWELLTRASGERGEVAVELLELPPAAVARRHRERYAGLVRAVASSADPDTARRGLGALPEWTRWTAGSADLLVDLVVDLDNTATWSGALTALLRASATTQDVAPLRAAVAGLLARVDLHDAEPDRDLPARQRLSSIASRLVAERGQVRWRAASRALAGDLAAAGLDAAAVSLALAAVPWEEPGAELEGLREVVRLAVRPTLRWRAAEGVSAEFGARLSRLSPTRLHEVASALVPECAPLALAVVSAVGRGTGWPEPWRVLLRGLRRHEDPDVREAASNVVTAVE
ncbi:hypothetical protein [Saccharothrix longispora]|uniref:hypothetical protein n=1 Tax=Saccharothrix longispora TaxID=33920 RepID=UPI0028FD7C63|nr:hypothetical protein [Saccharothrix longispora]MBY8847483.1 hypothetical protein [Saccharothrix sp. MB29]MDU0289118.1 hypothetical protein [Saccharothrix longispora]